MVKIMIKIKLKSFEFWICDSYGYDHHVYKFSDESMGFIKSYGQTCLILLQPS